MKTIGLIGGMSWESTVGYYQIINETVKRELGGLHSAQCVLYSVDFAEIEAWQTSGEWDKSAARLSDAAQSLERAGAELLIICTNTMHKVADQVVAAVSIPLVHIAEVTADALLADNMRRVALLGTKYTMEQDFYKQKLIDSGIEVLIPDDAERQQVSDIIFHELCLGKQTPQSKAAYLRVIDGLAARGAQAVILGCTEIGMFISQRDTAVPLYDTTALHARRAAMLSLGK